jgi:hypothetical protein
MVADIRPAASGRAARGAAGAARGRARPRARRSARRCRADPSSMSFTTGQAPAEQRRREASPGRMAALRKETAQLRAKSKPEMGAQQRAPGARGPPVSTPARMLSVIALCASRRVRRGQERAAPGHALRQFEHHQQRARRTSSPSRPAHPRQRIGPRPSSTQAADGQQQGGQQQQAAQRGRFGQLRRSGNSIHDALGRPATRRSRANTNAARMLALVALSGSASYGHRNCSAR